MGCPCRIFTVALLLLLVSDGNCFARYRNQLSSFAVLHQSAENEADSLLGKAAALRKEIESFESTKDEKEQESREQLEAQKVQERARRDKFSAVVPILKPDGSIVDETIDFPPRLSVPSFVTTFESNLPLGLLLGEESESGITVVDEIAGGKSAIGLQVGDVLRACSACKMEMTTPTWQLLAGGIGVPKTKRFMYAADDRPLEEVMEAIGSNRMDPDGRQVLLVIERPEASEEGSEV